MAKSLADRAANPSQMIEQAATSSLSSVDRRISGRQASAQEAGSGGKARRGEELLGCLMSYYAQ